MYGQWYVWPMVCMASGTKTALRDSRFFVVLPWSSSFVDIASCCARRDKVSSCERVRYCHVPSEALNGKGQQALWLIMMLARVRARKIRSLSWWWRIDLPALCLQDRLCEPLASTKSTGTYEVHTGWLQHSLTATQIASLSSLFPHEETTSSLASLWLSVGLDHKESLSAAMTGASQACCLVALVLSGNDMW